MARPGIWGNDTKAVKEITVEYSSKLPSMSQNILAGFK